MVNQLELEQFLFQIKEKIKVFGIVFRPRDKNLDSLAELEISAADRVVFISKLSVTDYYAGPKKDVVNSNRPDYYEFGLTIKRKEVYIKLSLGQTNKPVDCMSFHIAERAINYPLKNIDR